MADDDEHKPLHATARPPPGEEDVYSANTVVGEASDEILAIIRAENAKNASSAAPGAEDARSPAAEIKTPVATAATAERLATVDMAADPLPAPAAVPGGLEKLGAAPTTTTTVADPPAVPRSAAAAEDEKRDLEKRTLPPALGIVLFFLAVVAVLAALIR